MLSRSQRLSGDQVMAILAGKTAILHTPLVTIRVFSRDEIGLPCFAVIVSKKVSKSAVTRNLLRRRTFNALKEVVFPANKDYLISLKQKATFQEYKEDLQSIVTKIK